MAFILRRNIVPCGAGLGPVIEIIDETDADKIGAVEQERDTLGPLYEAESGTHFESCVQREAEKLEREWRYDLCQIDDGIAGNADTPFPICRA